MEHLFEKLQENAEGDIYPYHMPGHKRQSWGSLPKDIFGIDITEIDGFDNLHRPEGILLELQKKASQLYGAEESFYLVNGSTCGVLSAVSCALPFGGHILMARNCHKSAYHAAYLRNLSVSYLYPPYLKDFDVLDAVTPQQVRAALEQEPDIGAVIVVSPTYEGRITDIGAIAEIVHGRGIPLIVDEAHGAHLGLAWGYPKNSCQLGADLVVHSVHKTLPSLTQTALLHVNGRLIHRGRLKRFLQIYQSSSPSYVLMASIDNALQYVESDGEDAFARFCLLYGNMMKTLAECRYLKFLPESQSMGQTVRSDSTGRAGWDVGKLLISVKGTKLTGKGLYDILLQKYHLQAEMASTSYVLAMFTVNDGEEAYRRMTDALLEIDGSLGEDSDAPKEDGEFSGEGCDAPREDGKFLGEGRGVPNRRCENEEWVYPQTNVVPLCIAWDMHSEPMALEESIGKYVGEFINLYPPGVPLLVPGERMTRELSEHILRCLEQGLTVQGVDMFDGKAFTKVIWPGCHRR